MPIKNGMSLRQHIMGYIEIVTMIIWAIFLQLIFSGQVVVWKLVIGYWILGKFEGQGFVSDAVKLIEKTVFEIGFNRLVIRVDPNNKRSRSIPQRLHYVSEGIARQAIYVNGEFRDLEIFSKLKDEFLSTL